MQNKFGSTVRRLREAKNISLRKFAAKVNMSPTYLSKIERGEFRPPGEEKIIAIAKEFNQDPDIFLALGGRVASDILEIIKRNPKIIIEYIRSRWRIL